MSIRRRLPWLPKTSADSSESPTKARSYSRRLSYDEYKNVRYFAQLDGLRAISILLVITAHSTDPFFTPLHGAVGVTIFFVISGYLITTLLLREERREGSARIGAFYIRRAFRILPLYYLTLVAYIVFIGILHLQAGAPSLWRSLPWYVSYQNDLAPKGTTVFNQSWSLAIEEKYYLLWPLAFSSLLLLRKNRLAIAGGLVVLTALASLWSETHYFAIYTPILLGCVVAIVLDNPRLYREASRLATPPIALALIAALIVWDIRFENGSDVHIVFSLLIALLFPALLIGPRWIARPLTTRVMVYIGVLSYGIYLIHRLVKGSVDMVITPGSHSVPHELAHFALIVVGSIFAAHFLAEFVEQPMIRYGRRLASTTWPARTVPPETPEPLPAEPSMPELGRIQIATEMPTRLPDEPQL